MKEKFGIGEAFTRLECGEIVVCHIPERYPLALKLVDYVLMERVMNSWYPCRKGAATLAGARYWSDEGAPDDEQSGPAPTLEERIARIEQFIGPALR